MAEPSHRIASGYASPDISGGSHASRVEQYADFLWRSDPLADAVMGEFGRMPPPYDASMESAVHAFVATKFGPDGTYRHVADVPGPSAARIDATIAYCDYVFRRYGRFPAYTAAFRTVIGYQAGRVDIDFYDRFYGPDAIPDVVRDCTRRALRERLTLSPFDDE